MKIVNKESSLAIENNPYQNKKILILGGSYQHRKLVKKAKELGMIVYVTDYLPLEKSPAKQMADYPLFFNITDIDGIVDYCTKEHIDSVLSLYLDVTQIPYQKICEQLNLPCYGNAFQFDVLTNKKTFKQYCKKYGADIIKEYSEQDILKDNVKYPVIIKPLDSRGSRGQTVCASKTEAIDAIQYARSFSQSTSEVMIEEYLGSKNDIQLVYIVVNGKPLLYKTEDRYLGDKKYGLDKLCAASIGPSYLTDAFIQKANSKVTGFIEKLGLKNAPVFIQAIMDGDNARLYDPGLRMPGDDYDDANILFSGIDIPFLFIHFSLFGQFPEGTDALISKKAIHQKGFVPMVFPDLKPGKIADIYEEGITKITNFDNLVSYSLAYSVGDNIIEEKNIKQRFGEFVFACKNTNEMYETLKSFYNLLHVYDDKGQDMVISKIDFDTIIKYYSVD